MNKLFLLFVGSYFLTSCATSSVTSIVVNNDSNVILNTNHLKSVPVKFSVEQKAVRLLNQLFNTNAANKSMVLIINNDSDCDFTMNIDGDSRYILPVAARKSESIVVERGQYQMTSQVCQSQYKSFRTLSENTEVSIKYTLVSTPASNGNTVAALH